VRSTSERFLIKDVLRGEHHGRPLSLGALAKYGVSPRAASKYVASGWLVRLGHGAYQIAGAPLDRDQCLLFLQERVKGLHVAGVTALDWQGVRHFLNPNPRLTLWGLGRAALPDWFVRNFPGTYRSRSLFDAQTEETGLLTPLDITAGVRVSTRERALLEMLADIRTSADLENAQLLIVNAQSVRLQLMERLLETCTSVKVTRLLLKLATDGDLAYALNLRKWYRNHTESSTAARWIGELSDGTKMVLPR
jgi:hypothetical protein